MIDDPSITRAPITPASITLAVLAGGDGVRMGGAKSRLIVNGVPVLSRILDRLQWPGPTLLVTAPSNQHPPGHERFDREATDAIDSGGPAQGLLTALTAAETDALILIPVDMPMLTRDQLLQLATSTAAGVLCHRVVNGEQLIEPFPSLYRQAVVPALQSLLAQNRRSLRGLLNLPQCTSIDVTDWPTETWINLNTPDDLAMYERRIAEE
ncbi:MAG: molybdenum cofactor guanylyltransferase [Burkholderiales bacterium]|nr:molybdenum cofactor guanylyltransferase [Phycisphaerae bacterium]